MRARQEVEEGVQERRERKWLTRERVRISIRRCGLVRCGLVRREVLSIFSAVYVFARLPEKLYRIWPSVARCSLSDAYSKHDGYVACP